MQLILHVHVAEADAPALMAELEQIIDDEEDHGQWTHLSLRRAEWGTGGTLPEQHPVQLTGYAVDA